MLRQQMRPECRIHGIITNGGAAPNVIPEYAASTFLVRAPRIDTMWELYRRVVACAEGAAKAAGVGLKVTQPENVYEPLSSSRVMSKMIASTPIRVRAQPRARAALSVFLAWLRWSSSWRRNAVTA